jgi:uncharacterized protein
MFGEFMRIKLISALALTGGILCTSLPANAGTHLPDNRHISMTGQATVSDQPDMALISLEVRVRDKTSLAAKKSVDKKVNALLDGLSEFEISEQDVSASNINTNVEYNYGRDNQREIIGYTAARNIKVTLKQLDQLNDFIDFVLSVEINQVGNIQLQSSNAADLEKQAFELAVKDAKTQATLQANAFGASLGAVYSINSSQNNSQFSYGENDGFHPEMMRANVNTPPGQYLQTRIEFSSSITVVFDLDIQ